MRISKASHQHKKTSLWDGNQADAEPVLTTPDILNKATATIRASLGANSPRNIWTALGQHLHKHISLLKAVRIPGFGTVGLNQDNELIFVQDPVFLHMTRLCLASRKRGNCVQSSLAHSESVLDINENELAAEHLQNCSKDLVKSVISSVLAWVVSWAKEGQKMRLSLLPVGEWICDGESVEFCFSESFCNEINLQKARNEEAQGAISSDSEVNNQVEGSGATGGQSTVASLPQCSVEATTLLEFHSGKESVTVDTSVATVKDTAIRSGSPVERSRYKLRAPTLSSIAKQMPPHGQQRRRKDVEAVVNDIIAVTKTAHPVKNRICKNNQQEKTYSGPGGHQLDVIFRLRKRISNRSGEALQGLNAVVSVLRSLKTSAISCTQLNLSMRKLGVKISSSELNEIAVAFRYDKRGLIDTKKLLDALRGPPLAATRLELVSKAFHRMDPTGNGAVCIDEMIKHYDVGFLPQVRDGKQSRLEALTAFLQEWAGITPNANTITFDTFVMYYHVSLLEGIEVLLHIFSLNL
ncbi:unnamed protein product [Phytophthora lilii]|uniref:Unnamed protein product n=1 Tax=Phytophthora lilii TaxID=2077276 RepID=A0A9W6YHE4_9STRA|nr:unnamed protein product [Phytophthora lilii]